MIKKQLPNLPKKKDNSFFENVYDVTRLIPYGRVTNYGAIARYLGSPQSSRMVGWALNGCHTSGEFIPAHRVVNRNGLLTGKVHFGGPDVMQQLLKAKELRLKMIRLLILKRYFGIRGKNCKSGSNLESWNLESGIYNKNEHLRFKIVYIFAQF